MAEPEVMLPCLDHGRKLGKQAYALGPMVNGVRLGAHVMALIERTGEQPQDRDARHKCGNKRCIEGTHLEWGSRADNMRDTGLPVLSDEQVAEARDAYTGRWGQQIALARHFGVSQRAMNQILRGKRR